MLSPEPNLPALNPPTTLPNAPARVPAAPPPSLNRLLQRSQNGRRPTKPALICIKYGLSASLHGQELICQEPLRCLHEELGLDRIPLRDLVGDPLQGILRMMGVDRDNKGGTAADESAQKPREWLRRTGCMFMMPRSARCCWRLRTKWRVLLPGLVSPDGSPDAAP